MTEAKSGQSALTPEPHEEHQESAFRRFHAITLAAAVGLTVISGILVATSAPAIARFVVAGLALAALAALVGQAIDQVGERLGAGPTGLLQSTLGNLPELFVGIFALHAGLTGVVRSALIGSVLGNLLLVLGAAFLAGGLRHGTQRFNADAPRMYSGLLVLVVAALLVPTLADRIHTPAADHTEALSDICAIVLLVIYIASVPYFLRHSDSPTAAPAGPPAHIGAGTAAPTPATAPAESSQPHEVHEPDEPHDAAWPIGLAVLLLAIGSVGAALAADWFVDPLEQATHSLGLSQTFTGLVVVAIASNAVEHAVGVQFALKAKPDYAISTTLNSPLQVALLLTPVLVLLSSVIGPNQLTLVFPPLLVAALAISTIAVTIIVYDGEYNWVEGAALLGLYIIIAGSFWWG